LAINLEKNKLGKKLPSETLNFSHSFLKIKGVWGYSQKVVGCD
jgi:hypothetical protein